MMMDRLGEKVSFIYKEDGRSVDVHFWIHPDTGEKVEYENQG